MKVQEGSGRIRHQWLPGPLPPSTKKILTGFLRFAWAPLGSSGGVRTPGPPRPATPLFSGNFPIILNSTSRLETLAMHLSGNVHKTPVSTINHENNVYELFNY